jgi:hypothetical protein
MNVDILPRNPRQPLIILVLLVVLLWTWQRQSTDDGEDRNDVQEDAVEKETFSNDDEMVDEDKTTIKLGNGRR